MMAPAGHRPAPSRDLYGDFGPGAVYEAGRGCLHAHALQARAWFDSRPERDVALAADASPDVAVGVRLHRGAVAILWRGYPASTYQPALLVVGHLDADSPPTTGWSRSKPTPRLRRRKWRRRPPPRAAGSHHATAAPDVSGR